MSVTPSMQHKWLTVAFSINFSVRQISMTLKLFQELDVNPQDREKCYHSFYYMPSVVSSKEECYV